MNQFDYDIRKREEGWSRTGRAGRVPAGDQVEAICARVDRGIHKRHSPVPSPTREGAHQLTLI